MKLAEFTNDLWRQISREEHELELSVVKATIRIQLNNGKDIILHEWEYEAKKEGDK